MSKDGELNNNAVGRAISNGLDYMMGGKDESSKIRGTLHYAHHKAACELTGNQRECMAAEDRWNAAYGGPTNNLDKYDEKTGYNKKK